MRPTRRVARRINGVMLGFAALAAFLAPGPSSIDPAAALDVADPPVASVGAEHPVADPGPVTPKDPGTGSQVSVAHGGSVHLSAWTDGHDVVRVARVSEAGELLDPLGIRLGPIERYESPDVAFDGANFLVTWRSEGTIVAKRVSPAGEVLDASTIDIATITSWGQPKVAFDGDHYLVVWADAHPVTGNFDIFGRRVRPDGDVVDAEDLVISTAPSGQYDLDLAFNGTDHLLVWTDDTGVHSSIVDTAGVASTPAGVPLSTGPGRGEKPSVTAVGPAFFVAWAQNVSDSLGIRGTRVDPAGVPLDPAGIAIAGGGTDTWPGVASDGSSVLVTWVTDPSGLARARYARVDAAGTVLDPTGPDVPTSTVPRDVTFDGTYYFVGGARAARVSPAGAVVDPAGIAVSTKGNTASELDSASDGTNTFVVWTDDRFGGTRIYGGRSGPDGEVLDGSGMAISTGADVPDTEVMGHTAPAIAFDGTNYLVVWIDRTERGEGARHMIRGALVRGDGEVLERFDIATVGFRGPTMREPAVAFGGGVYLVAWTVGYLTVPEAEIAATRIDTDGDPVGPPYVLLNDPDVISLPGKPAISYGSSNFLVVWQEMRDFYRHGVYGTTVSPAGEAALPTTAMSTTNAQEMPDVVWHDGSHLVVWKDGRNHVNGTEADIYGTRVDDAGAVLDPEGIAISTAPGPQDTPRVAANGRFFVLWTDRRLDFFGDIYGTRVESDGTVARPNGQVVTNAAGPEDHADVSPGADAGEFTVVFTRYNPLFDTERAYRRTVAPK